VVSKWQGGFPLVHNEMMTQRLVAQVVMNVQLCSSHEDGQKSLKIQNRPTGRVMKPRKCQSPSATLELVNDVSVYIYRVCMMTVKDNSDI